MEVTDKAWLNEDFKTSQAAVTLCLKELTRDDDLQAGSILQILSVTNVSVPLKSQSESRVEYDPKHHILKISLTDGKQSAVGILYEPHNKLNTDTPPGTKIKVVRNIPFGSSRVLKFTRTNVEVLGGYVEKLVEHWRVQKEHDRKSAWGKLITNPGDVGPPKFKPLNASGRLPTVPAIAIADLRNAKAMDLLEEAKAKSDQTQGKSESKTEFDLQRQEAISDLANQAVKKTFSVSKQFPQSSQLPQPAPVSERRQRTSSYQKSNDDPGQEPVKPRFQNRKDKMEEDQLLAEYTYRGSQPSLKEHFSTFFGSGSQSPNQGQGQSKHTTTEVDQLSSQFARMGVHAQDETSREFSSSQTFHRGGGDGGRGRGHRGRSRGGRRGGRGRGRESYDDRRHHYDAPPPPRPSASYVPDLSSFPSLGVDAHFQK